MARLCPAAPAPVRLAAGREPRDCRAGGGDQGVPLPLGQRRKVAQGAAALGPGTRWEWYSVLEDAGTFGSMHRDRESSGVRWGPARRLRSRPTGAATRTEGVRRA